MNTNIHNFILIGGVGVGKTSLFNSLLGIKGDAIKTQALVFHNERTIDTPGEYFDNPRLYSILIQTMTDIDTVLYVQSSDCTEKKIPYGLFHVYESKNIIGIVSKVDLPDAKTDEVENILKDYGIDSMIFKVSVYDESSINKLRDYLIRLNNKKQA
jgi:ethanolamine utilization protein EutP